MKKIFLIMLLLLLFSGCSNTNMFLAEPLVCDPINTEDCAEVAQGNLKVIFQDQVTDTLEIYLYEEIGNLTIATNLSQDQYDMTVGAGHSLIAGDWVIIQEANHVYQSRIDSVNVNVITMTTRFDYSYTTAAFIKEININMAVDGSVNERIFHIKPEPGFWTVEWDVTRIICSIGDNSAMDSGKFGGLPELDRGFTLRKADGDFNNFFNVRTNGDFADIAFDVAYSDKAPSGQFGFSVRKSWAGPSKSGVAIRLDPDEDESLQGLVQDDIIGLLSFRCKPDGSLTN